jgi:hypothetical protein
MTEIDLVRLIPFEYPRKKNGIRTVLRSVLV